MKSFKALIALFALSFGLIGCSSTPQTDTTAPDAPNRTDADPGPRGTNETTNGQLGGASDGGGSVGIAPMGGMGAGGMTPVSGTDSVTGAGGGGVQQAAKNKAKEVAASSPSSIGGATDDNQ